MTTVGYDLNDFTNDTDYRRSSNEYHTYLIDMKYALNIKHQNLISKVAVSRLGLPILGTGSADQTAKVHVASVVDNEKDLVIMMKILKMMGIRFVFI